MPSKTDINPATGKQYAVNPATGQWDDNYWSTVVEPRLKAQYRTSSTSSVSSSSNNIKIPSKTDINPATGKQYAVNPATGQWDDNYFATVVEPKLKASAGTSSPQSSASDLIKSVMDTYTKQFDEYTSKLNEYDKNNPFVFDDVLAKEREQAKQRLDPYYTQTLNDYLTGVDLQRKRSTEDERTALTQLNQDVTQLTGQQRLEAQDAIDRSREGAADAGLYSSGAQLRAQGRVEQAYNQTNQQTLTNAQRQTEKIQTGTERNLQDLALQEAQKRRDLTREQSYNVESQAQAGAQTAQQQNTLARTEYAGTPPGVNPTQYQTSLYSYLGL